jgi:Tfp pilus assembly protein FimT
MTNKISISHSRNNALLVFIISNSTHNRGGITMKKLGARGFTLTGLLFALATSGILMGIAISAMQGVRERNDAAYQIRQMHRDMMNARIRAYQGRRTHFLVVTSNEYQIIEDTNESGGKSPDRGDIALWTAPKQLRFPSQWSGTVTLDASGSMSNSAASYLTDTTLAIRFDTDGIKSECNCIAIGPTRIRDGIWDGAKCVEDTKGMLHPDLELASR